MSLSRGLAAIVLIAQPVCGQQDHASSRVSSSTQRRIVETTICEVLRKPWAYDNKFVKVRATIQVSFEYSTLSDTKCDDSIWLAFADGAPRRNQPAGFKFDC